MVAPGHGVTQINGGQATASAALKHRNALGLESVWPERLKHSQCCQRLNAVRTHLDARAGSGEHTLLFQQADAVPRLRQRDRSGQPGNSRSCNQNGHVSSRFQRTFEQAPRRIGFIAMQLCVKDIMC